MRKLTVRLKLNKLISKVYGDLFDYVESMSLVDLIKIDIVAGIKIGVIDIVLKDGVKIEDLKLPNNTELVDIFYQNGNKCTCLFKTSINKKYLKIAKLFDFDIIWDKPSISTKDYCILSATGGEKEINRVLKLIKLFGEVQSVSINNSDYRGNNILSCLTDKQKDIVESAVELGYYNYPRKIDAGKLAEKLGYSKPTVIEHLRKSENRLISSITGRYPKQ